jgi:dihydrofolate reductase
MYNINYILATDLNWALGYKGDLIYFFKRDLQRFKDLTKNKTVVMGSKTWTSLPIKLPLRTNVVLTSKSVLEDEKQPDKLIHNIEDILNMSLSEEIWVIGGASLYKDLIKYVNKIELTLIHNDNVEFDVRVDYLEEDLKNFDLVSSETFEEEEKNQGRKMNIEFKTYVRTV